jgi:geranylgeranylglycerol-phosphate geranylgeranyltransferase
MFIQIIRPHNAAAAALSTFVGSSLADSPAVPWLLLTAVAATAAAGNVINDLSDVDIDRINKPGRPLPSGELNERSAKTLYAVLLCTLLVMVWFLPAVQGVWIAIWAFLLHLYSVKLKRAYLAGNLLVSIVSASGFLLGALAGGRLAAGIVPAGFTLLFVMGRELVKDSEDMTGDRLCGARTVAVVSGRKAALTAATVIFIVLAAAFPIPSFVDLYGRLYGLIMFVSVIPILIVSAVLSSRARSLGIVSMLLKYGMFFGILAFYLGKS